MNKIVWIKDRKKLSKQKLNTNKFKNKACMELLFLLSLRSNFQLTLLKPNI